MRIAEAKVHMWKAIGQVSEANPDTTNIEMLTVLSQLQIDLSQQVLRAERQRTINERLDSESAGS